MRAYAIQKFGQLDLIERPEPLFGSHEVVVQIKACSLNYRDLLTLDGQYNPRQPLPLIPLSDGVGEVVAVGEGVSRVRVGERVAGIFAQRWLDGPLDAAGWASTLGGPLDGMLAERVVLSEEGVVPVPAHLSDAEAACLPCAAVTAWNALFEQGGLTAGQTVLLLGTGGVSIFALQFAKLGGARVILTSRSEEKLARARALGADLTINTQTCPDWDRSVRELTGSLGADLVVEVGGAPTLSRSLAAVRLGGQVAAIGVLGGTRAEIPLTSILMKHVRLQGVLVGSRAMFARMNRAVSLHQLTPVIDRVFPFSAAGEAFHCLRSGQHFGKIAVQVAS